MGGLSLQPLLLPPPPWSPGSDETPWGPPPRTQTPHGSVSHEPSVVTSVSHERSVLTRRARRAHLHLEFSPDHEIVESRSSLGWKGPQSPSHSTPCHGQDTSHHSRRLREAMSVHTSHILWDEGIRETPPGARTPPAPPEHPHSHHLHPTRLWGGTGSTHRSCLGTSQGFCQLGILSQPSSSHRADPGTGTATSVHPGLGTHGVTQRGRSGEEASGAVLALVTPPKRRRRRKGDNSRRDCGHCSGSAGCDDAARVACRVPRAESISLVRLARRSRAACPQLFLLPAAPAACLPVIKDPTSSPGCLRRWNK